jgi:hypothetical protein
MDCGVMHQELHVARVVELSDRGETSLIRQTPGKQLGQITEE